MFLKSKKTFEWTNIMFEEENLDLGYYTNLPIRHNCWETPKAATKFPTTQMIGSSGIFGISVSIEKDIIRPTRKMAPPR